MYRFVSATHVLLNSSLDMSVYLINVYICMKDDLQLGKLKENCLLLKLYRKLRKMLMTYLTEWLKCLTGDQKVAGSIPVWGSETFF